MSRNATADQMTDNLDTSNLLIRAIDIYDFQKNLSTPVSICDNPVQSISCIEAPPQSIYGVVWRDYNANQIRDKSEFGISNAVVSAYLSNNVLYATTTTDSLGQYFFQAPTGTQLRLEVTSPASYLTPTTPETIFITSPSCYTNFGYYNEAEDFCFTSISDLKMWTTIFVGGNSTRSQSTMGVYSYNVGANEIANPSMTDTDLSAARLTVQVSWKKKKIQAHKKLSF